MMFLTTMLALLLTAPVIQDGTLHWKSVPGAHCYNVRFRLDNYEFLTLATTNQWKLQGLPAGRKLGVYITAHPEGSAEILASTPMIFFTLPSAPKNLRSE